MESNRIRVASSIFQPCNIEINVVSFDLSCFVLHFYFRMYIGPFEMWWNEIEALSEEFGMFQNSFSQYLCFKDGADLQFTAVQYINKSNLSLLTVKYRRHTFFNSSWWEPQIQRKLIFITWLLTHVSYTFTVICEKMPFPMHVVGLANITILYNLRIVEKRTFC